MELNETAVRIAIKIIKSFEGCELRAYPDAASPLYKELSKHGILLKYMRGELELPEYLKKLSGAPWSAMYGETKGIEQGMVFSQEDADNSLNKRVREFMSALLKISPKLVFASPEKIAAMTSFVYNIGMSQYKTSTACKRVAVQDWQGAAQALKLFNKAQGQVLQGLVNRRKVEADLLLSV